MKNIFFSNLVKNSISYLSLQHVSQEERVRNVILVRLNHHRSGTYLVQDGQEGLKNICPNLYSNSLMIYFLHLGVYY